MNDFEAGFDMEQPSSAEEEMEEVSSAEEEEDQPSPTTASPRKRKRSEQGLRKPRIRDIREIVEHLVIVGNHHRHQYWRRNEYEKIFAREDSIQSPGGDDKQAQSLQDGLPDGNETNGKNQLMLLHVEDNLVYGKNKYRGSGDFITFWPNPPSADGSLPPPNIVSDKQWETLWGDGIDPIAFSNQRLSATTSHELWDRNGNPKKDGLHPRYESKSIQSSEAARSILLKCWHRAVHAASQIITTDASTLSKEEQVESTNLGISRDNIVASHTPPRKTLEAGLEQRRGSRHDDDSYNSDSSASIDLMNTKCGDSSASYLSQSNAERQTNTSERLFASMDSMACSKEKARDLCQRLGISIPETPKNGDSFCCPVCQTERDSLEHMETHYYGKTTTRGCCWVRIERCRASLLEEALTAEVSVQARQLIQLVARGSVKPIQVLRGAYVKSAVPAYNVDLFRPAFDWRHVHGILREVVSAAVLTRKSTDNSQSSSISDTVDARLSIASEKDQSAILPALLLNQFTLEATTNRLQERYTKMPK